MPNRPPFAERFMVCLAVASLDAVIADIAGFSARGVCIAAVAGFVFAAMLIGFLCWLEGRRA